MVLAFETSCDETSVAVVSRGKVLANLVSSQTRLHSDYGGVVPELAAREHLRNLLPVAREALAVAGCEPASIRAVAATRGPGLPGALTVGFRVAGAVAFVLRKPFIGIHHHEAHLYSPWVQRDPLRECFDQFLPCVSLIASGGHTILVHQPTEGRHRVLGSTVDDAAGECFDKTAKLMGLGYPGGPEIDRLSDGGNPGAWKFPRPMLDDPNDDFSFSGLKTAVRYFLRDRPGLLEDPRMIADLCASVQAAIVDVLVGKTMRACRRLKIRCVTASGGVTCNRSLRREFEQRCRMEGVTLRLAPAELCTDNAAMVGLLAERKLNKGLAPGADSPDAESLPGWDLAEIQTLRTAATEPAQPLN